MSVYYGSLPLVSEDSLEHFGILGMKWGVRRFQNEDGTLTSAGKRRYGKDISKFAKKYGNAAVKKSVIATAPNAHWDSKEKAYVIDTRNYKNRQEVDDRYENEYYKKHDLNEFTKNHVVDVDAFEDSYKSFLASTGFEDQWAAATLKDIGFEDTEAGRKWMKEFLNTQME